MQKKWSKAEEEYLVDNKGKLSHVEMADTLGKSVSAVNHKMAKLGATKKRTGSRLSEQGKKCSKCLIVKPEEEFSNNKSRIDGKEVWCKNCRAFDLREKKYGMSEEEYRHRVSLQNGKCEKYVGWDARISMWTIAMRQEESGVCFVQRAI